MLQPPIQTHHKTYINDVYTSDWMYIQYTSSYMSPNHIFSQTDYIIACSCILSFDWPVSLVFAQNLPKMLLGNP